MNTVVAETMTLRIDRIRNKRELFLRSRGAPEAFKSWWKEWKKHHARWGRASAIDVAQMEASWRIELPEGYRRFVTEVADGGVGPGCGMFGIHEARDAPEWTGDVSVPFVYGNEDAERVLERRSTREPPRAWKPQSGDGLPHGSLLLAHTGCGCFDILVVNGEQRDAVWFYDTQQLFPLGRRGKPLSFLDWYESWLDGWLKSLAE
jgi:hypothetical protein